MTLFFISLSPGSAQSKPLTARPLLCHASDKVMKRCSSCATCGIPRKCTVMGWGFFFL